MLPQLELPFFIDLFAIYAIVLVVTLSLNLEFGYAGVPNFGKVLAVAGGAYVVGYLPGRLLAGLFAVDGIQLPTWFMDGTLYVGNSWKIVNEINTVLAREPLLSLEVFLITLVAAALAGAALGYIASYPAIRLREDYLAMTLLAMGEGIRIIGENYTPLVGGQLPVAVPDPLRWIGNRYLAVTVVLAIFAILVLAYLELLLRSPLGRTLRAMRDSEDAAKALGKDVVKLRMKVLIVGSAIAAVGGALHGFYVVSVYSSTYERVTWTFWPWAMVVLGGAANNIGVAVGVLALVSLKKLITISKWALAPFLPFNPVWLDPLLTGILVIIVLLFRPAGLIPEKPTRTIKIEPPKKS